MFAWVIIITLQAGLFLIARYICRCHSVAELNIDIDACALVGAIHEIPVAKNCRHEIEIIVAFSRKLTAIS